MAFISPDCATPFKCGACTGTAWNDEAGQVVACECTCHPIIGEKEAVDPNDMDVNAALRIFAPGIEIQMAMGKMPFVNIQLMYDPSDNTATYVTHAGGGIPLFEEDAQPGAPFETDAVIAMLEVTIELLKKAKEEEVEMQSRTLAEVMVDTSIGLDDPEPDNFADALFAPPGVQEVDDHFPKGL